MAGGQGGGGLGSLLGGLGGAILGGALFGQPQLGFLAGSMIGGLIQGQPKAKDTKQVHEQESLADINVTSQAYGQTIPRLYGRKRFAGNIIWATEKIEHVTETEETVEQGGGGGGGGKGGGGGNPTSTTVTISKTYSVSFAMALCEGPIVEVSRVWFDATLVYDKSQDNNLINIEINEIQNDTKGVSAPDDVQRAVLFFGTDTQEPSSFIEAIEGVGEVPAYRDTAYILFENLDLGTLGRIPNITVEASTSALPVGQPFDGAYIDDSTVATNNNTGENLWVAFSSSFFDDGRGRAQIVGFDPVGVTPTFTWAFGDNVKAVDFIIFTEGTAGNAKDYAVFGASQGTNSMNGLFLHNGSPVFDDEDMDDNLLPAGETSIVIEDFVIGGSGFYTSISDKDRVMVNSLATGLNIAEITMDAGPGRMFVASDGKIWVANSRGASPDGTVQVITGLAVSATTGTAGDDPQEFTESEDAGATKYVYVSLRGADAVRKHTLAGAVDATITVGTATGALPGPIVTASDDFVWVANTGETTVSRINPDTDAVQNFTLPVIPTTLCPVDGGSVFVFSETTNIVYLVQSDGTIANDLNIISDDATIAIPSTEDPDDCYFLAGLSAQVWRVSNPGGGSGSTDVEVANPGDANGIGCVVYDLCRRSGLNASFIDVSGLDNTPVNMLVTNVTAARNPLQVLVEAYAITSVETNGVLKWYYKGGTAVADIPERSINASNDSIDETGLSITRLQAVDFPTAATITYDSPGRNFARATQGIRMTSHSAQDNHLKLDLPLALTDRQARNIAEVHLFESHLNNQHFEFNLPPRWLSLDPFDIVEIDGRGINYTIRLLELNFGNSFVITAKAVNHRSYIYEGFQGVPGESPNGDIIIPELVDSQTILVDSPPLNSLDFGLRVHDAIHQEIPGSWAGASVYRSTDGGATYFLIDNTQFSTTVGTVAVATPAPPALTPDDNTKGSYYYWDDVTTISVTLRFGTLASSTDAGVLAGSNRAIIGKVDPTDNVFRGEMIQFVNATLVSGTTYTLSRLLRGRKGTEDRVDDHTTDEFFILINSRLIDRALGYGVSNLDVDYKYKVVDNKVSLADAVEFDHRLSGRSMRPWHPQIIGAFMDQPSPFDDDWFIRWRERPRLVNELIDNVGVTRDPDIQSWKVKIYSDATFTDVVREFNISASGGAEDTHEVQYTTLSQTADFGFAPIPGFFFGIQYVASTRVGIEVFGFASG